MRVSTQNLCSNLLQSCGHYVLITVVAIAALVLKPTKDPPVVIQDGPVCFMAENPPSAVGHSVPLTPPPPPLPVLWDKGTDIEVAAVNDILYSYSSDPFLVAALIQVESSGNPKAVSSAGCRGLGQLCPATAKAMAQILDLDYYDGIEFLPAWNARVSVEYIEHLLQVFDGDQEKALQAYFRGPSNVRHILRTYGEFPPHVKAEYSDKIFRRKGEL